MGKLFGKGDIHVTTCNTSFKGKWIPPHETKSVIGLVGDAAYILYSFYRTFPFKEAEEITDKYLAHMVGFSEQKVRRARLILDKEDLFRIIRYGSKTDGITKVIVGADTVALFDAGVPSEILEPKALNKLKKEFKITTTAELIKNINQIQQAYTDDPTKYS